MGGLLKSMKNILLTILVILSFTFTSCAYSKEASRPGTQNKPSQNNQEESLAMQDNPSSRIFEEDDSSETLTNDKNKAENADIDFRKRLIETNLFDDNLAFVDVLTSKASFMLERNGEIIYLQDYYLPFGLNGTSNDISYLSDFRFTVLDLDGDGTSEMVLDNGNIGKLIFLNNDEQIIGFEFSHRTVRELKDDGSFSWSNSAFHSGWSTILFSGNSYTEKVFLEHKVDESNPEHPKEMWYYNGFPVTEEEHNTQYVAQRAKNEAEWVAFADIF